MFRKLYCVSVICFLLKIFCFSIAIPAIILCPSLSSIFGSGLIFTTGILYGMMALGKK